MPEFVKPVNECSQTLSMTYYDTIDDRKPYGIIGAASKNTGYDFVYKELGILLNFTSF